MVSWQVIRLYLALARLVVDTIALTGRYCALLTPSTPPLYEQAEFIER